MQILHYTTRGKNHLTVFPGPVEFGTNFNNPEEVVEFINELAIKAKQAWGAQALARASMLKMSRVAALPPIKVEPMKVVCDLCDRNPYEAVRDGCLPDGQCPHAECC